MLCYNRLIWDNPVIQPLFQKDFNMMTSTKKSAQSALDMGWHLLVLFAMVIGVSLVPDQALAAASAATSGSGNAIQAVFCNLVIMLNGTTGKAVATLAVIAVGVGALLGKISWGMALIVALGVALVFGAASIVSALGGDSTSCTASALTTT